MNGEIICVGTELLLGDIVNTNAQYLSSRLSELGINLYNQSVIGDNSKRLASAVEEALNRSEIIILTGGLGPTTDDITKETVCEVMKTELYEDAAIMHIIEDYYARQGRVMPRGVSKQALRPSGAFVFPNDVGTAPGFAIRRGNRHIILLPGPPNEMKCMFDKYVFKYLEPLSENVILSDNIHIYGIGESEVGNQLGTLLDGKNPTVATYAKTGEVLVRVTASGRTRADAEGIKREVTLKIKKLFGSKVYCVGESSLSKIAVEELKQKKLTVATAESCTAGMLSKSITDVSGSSAVFHMGVSAYANETKCKVLNVPEEVINENGAVSPETAALMAKGIRDASGADLGIGITGVAGPEPSEGKPVGLVYISMTDGKQIWIRELNAAFNNDRDRIRQYATLAALDLIRRYTISLPKELGGGAKHGESLKICRNIDDFTVPEIATISNEKTETAEKADSAAKSEPEAEKAPENTTGTKAPEKAEIQNEPEAVEKPKSEPVSNKELADNSESMAALMIGNDGEKRNKSADLQDYYGESIEEAEKGNSMFVAVDETYGAKKAPWYKRLAKSIFPWKGDSVKEVIRKIIFLLALLTFIGAGTYLVNYYLQGANNESITDSARKIYNAGNNSLNENGMLTRFEDLYKQNKDIIGWIRIDGTKIDYPVYQTDDNDYYIDHDMSRNSSRYGAIFADCNAKITQSGNSKNVVLYGHNMLDGSMFTGITDYKKLKFYKENPLVSFDTIYATGQYKVFAVFIVNVNKRDDDGYVFNYRQNQFPNESNFLNWINNIKVRSIINTGVDVAANDEIIALSTCSYEFDDARTVVMARRVRSGESLYTDTSISKNNKNPLYPQAYYDKNGGKKPDVSVSLYTGSTSSENAENTISGYTGNSSESYTSADIDTSRVLEKVKVTNYVGLSLSSAIYKINDQGLYITSVEYDGSSVKRNDVLEQSIKADTEVVVGTGITLKVTGQPAKITIPNFVGKTLKEAEKSASSAGLTLSLIKMSSSKPENTVLMQSVAPKTVVEDRSVVLYVSNGRNKVPNVVGKKTDKATEALEKEGFKIKVVKIGTVDKTKIDVVCSQQSQAGVFADIGTKITVYVGKKQSDISPYESTITESKSSTTSNAASSKATTSKAASSKAATSKATSSGATASKATSSNATTSKVVSANPASSAAASSAAASSASASSTAVAESSAASAEANP